MDPRFARWLRPIAAVTLFFFSWISIEPWNYALAAQSPSPALSNRASASQPKALTPPEIFQNSLRSVKEKVREARDGEAYQKQLNGLLDSLDQAVLQSVREIESTRRAVDALARAIERKAPSQEALTALRTQQKALKTSVGQVTLNAAGIEGLMRGMTLPADLTKHAKQGKERVASRAKAFEAALGVVAKRAEERKGFDSQEHQTFLTASVDLEREIEALPKRVKAVTEEATPEQRRAQLWEQALGLRDDLVKADQEIRDEFNETELFLKEKGLPQEILNRHEKAVADYEQNYTKLSEYLSAVDKANRAYQSASQRGNNSSTEEAERDIESKLAALNQFLKDNVKDPPHQSLDPNNLPHRTPKPQERKPRLKKEEFTEFQPQIRLAYNGDPSNLMLAQATPDLPTPADLAQTIEVQFTPEIQALAAQLEHNPVKIYNWVRNNIEFVPTWGSIQGADHCLLTRVCNAFDTASLLVALLRTSDIPARYVMGTIDIPIERFMNWVGGFTDERASREFVASGGIPVTGLLSGSQVVGTQMEHVWVEAYVDYVPSRGTVHKQGDTWVPVDPSFKQYQYAPGIDLLEASGLDAETLLDDARNNSTFSETESYVTNISQAFLDAQIQDVGANIGNYIQATLPSATMPDLFDRREIIPSELSSLSSTLPYEVVAAPSPVADLPAQLRHRFELRIMDPGTPSSSPELVFQSSLPELRDRRITLSYSAATATDRALLGSVSNGFDVPAYLVSLVPIVGVDGITVGNGSPIGFGADIEIEIALMDANGQIHKALNVLTAGAYHAITLNTSAISRGSLSKVSASLRGIVDIIESEDGELYIDDLIGGLLQCIGAAYFGMTDSLNVLSSRLANVRSMRLPSGAMVSSKLEVVYLFSLPKEVGVTGFNIDVDLNRGAYVSLVGDRSRVIAGIIESGLTSSLMEQFVFNYLFGVEAVSTAKVMELANQNGIRIYEIRPDNVSQVIPILQVDAEVKSAFRDLTNARRSVFAPQSEVGLFDWRGIGFAVLDPSVGDGSYIIKGGSSGGDSAQIQFGVMTAFEGIQAEGLILGHEDPLVVRKSLERLSAVASIAGSAVIATEQLEKVASANLSPEAVSMLAGLIYGLFAMMAAVEVISYFGGPVGIAVGFLVGAYLNLILKLVIPIVVLTAERIEGINSI